MFTKFLKPILIASIFFLASCSSKKEEAPAPEPDTHDPNLVSFTDEQNKTVGVEIGTISQANLSNYVKASGTIDVPPSDLISVTSPYGGTVRSTNVIEGKFVKRGEVIATIENPEFVQVQQDYLDNSNQLVFLRQTLDRQEELVKENIAARKSVQQAQSEYNSMNARVEGLKAKLRLMNINPASLKSNSISARSNIIAPSDGYITHVYSNTGKFVGANEILADMANTHNILVKVKVFEKDLPQVKLGQRVRFRATGDTTEREASVFLIGKDIDTDRTVEVHGKIKNPAATLLPGMFINGILEIGSSSQPALPQSAIVQSGGKNYIFIRDDSATAAKVPTKQATAAKGEGDKKDTDTHVVFRRIEIGTGPTENGMVAVILPKSFDMKSKVVIRGAYDLLSTMNNSGEED